MADVTSTGYFRNIWRWAVGFRHLDEVPLKPGWEPGWRWRLVYAVDYGAACIILAIGVQPISRWAGERIKHAPWRWLAALLNRLDAHHTANAGPLMWDTAPCRPAARYLVTGFWAVLLALAIA